MASGIENNSDAWSTTFSIMSLLSPSVFIENRKDMLAITLNTIQKNHHRLKSELVAKEKAIADGETNDQRQQLISLAYIIVFIISGFLILKWIYRANYNARQLGYEFVKPLCVHWKSKRYVSNYTRYNQKKPPPPQI
jgi:hypothetical protein